MINYYVMLVDHGYTNVFTPEDVSITMIKIIIIVH